MNGCDIFRNYLDNGCFILDVNLNPEQHVDVDFVSYRYNIHHYNLLNIGSCVLFRRPRRTAENRQFYIYGGALVSNITEPDEDGYVTASYVNTFMFNDPIYESDPRMIEFRTRRMPENINWGGFWSVYGMNRIAETDAFMELINNIECTPVNIVQPRNI